MSFASHVIVIAIVLSIDLESSRPSQGAFRYCTSGRNLQGQGALNRACEVRHLKENGQ